MGYSLSNMHTMLISLTGSITDFKWSRRRMNPYPNSNDTDNKSKQFLPAKKNQNSLDLQCKYTYCLTYCLVASGLTNNVMLKAQRRVSAKTTL